MLKLFNYHRCIRCGRLYKSWMNYIRESDKYCNRDDCFEYSKKNMDDSKEGTRNSIWKK